MAYNLKNNINYQGHQPPQGGRLPGFLWTTPTGLLILMAWLVLWTTGLIGAGLAQDETTAEALDTHVLESNLVAVVSVDGVLEIREIDSGDLVLRGEAPSLQNARRRRSGESSVFTARSLEGAAGGLRGFSSGADDDGDGLVDEDRLDGRDNDGDGRIDEDYAAISDAMSVINRTQAGRTTHLEHYRWDYSHLTSALFLSAALDASGYDETKAYTLEAPSGYWEEAEVFSRSHSIAGRGHEAAGHAFVAQVPLTGHPGIPARAGVTYGGKRTKVWLGVLDLNSEATARNGLIVIDGSSLAIPFGDESRDLVVCVSESWLQLNRLLCQARRVHAGVTDPIDGRHAPWIVSPLCSGCRLAASPEFTWTLDSAGDLHITATINSGQSGLLDPDLFQLDGQPLGSPAMIVWRPANSDAVNLDWSAMTQGLLHQQPGQLTDPYGEADSLRGHGATGELEFRFAGIDAELAGLLAGKDEGLVLTEKELRGRWLDGRPLKESAVPVQTETTSSTENWNQGTLLDSAAAEAGADNSGAVSFESEKHRPSLSPALLEGWPNPFRDIIQLRFRVPLTMEEAFVWEDEDDRPAGLDLQSAVPWRSGDPSVSVKIYSVNGQELMTLHQGAQGSGEYTVQWNGTNAFGRHVASGTYFCKLQMDEWSVTRRIVFLR